MQTDSLGRRSRFVRCSTGKRLVLTNRDIEILRLLYRYRYLRNPQLLAFLRPKSVKRFHERLGDLFHETGYIHRPPAQWRYYDPRHSSVVYELSIKGQRVLEERDLLPARATTLSRRTSARKSQFTHAQMIVDALVAIELATLENHDQRFVCVDEILARTPERTQKASNLLSVPVTIEPCAEFPNLHSTFKTHIIPDALYGIEYVTHGEKRYRFWLLECEHTSPIRRSHPRASSLARKQAAYNALIRSGGYKTHWGIPNLKMKVISGADLYKSRGASQL